MKRCKTIAILLGWLVTAGPAVLAEETAGYPVGFCNGEMVSSSSVKFSGNDADVSAAIMVPSSYVATIAGNRMESVRVAVCSTFNTQNLTVWVRSSLDGENLASGQVDVSALSQGWNDISFDAPYEIPEGASEGFYIGYTYHQKAKAGLISALPQPHEGALWVKGPGAEWTDKSQDGTLCLEGLVYGDNLPQHNLSFVDVIAPAYYIISAGKMECVAQVRNLAVNTVHGFDIEAVVDGASAPCRVHVDCDLPFRAIDACKFSISPEFATIPAEPVNARFTITAVDGEPDEDVTDNSAEAGFKIIGKAFNRLVLVEEFTTEKCKNCPRVAGFLHDILANPWYAENMEVVCHHAGYDTDWLTTDFDEEYLWLYADNSCYAPAMSIDRSYFEDDYTDVGSSVFCPYSKEQISDFVDQRLQSPAMVSVNVEAPATGESGNVTVTVSGERVSSEYVPDDVRLTVWLVEDNIKANYQSGATAGYIHQHVNRAVNATWGEAVEWTGDNYTYSCGFTLDPSWKTADMKVVAAISRYNPDDRLGCVVANAGSCKLGSSGVVTVGDDSRQAGVAAIYTPAGVRSDRLVKGVNIVVYDDGTTRKLMVR